MDIEVRMDRKMATERPEPSKQYHPLYSCSVFGEFSSSCLDRHIPAMIPSPPGPALDKESQ